MVDFEGKYILSLKGSLLLMNPLLSSGSTNSYKYRLVTITREYLISFSTIPSGGNLIANYS